MTAKDAPLAALSVKRHVKFWTLHMSMLQRTYTSADNQRYVLG